jgi:hypothetical protein
MALPPLVWTREGDSEYVDHGPFRATILTSSVARGALAIRIRIGLREGTDDGEDTPVYVQVAAEELARQLPALKAHAEEELRIRAAQHGVPERQDEAQTDRVLTSSEPVASTGFYMTRPPRGGK